MANLDDPKLEDSEALVTTSDFGAPFDYSDADVIIRSSDRVDFHIYKFHLIKASPAFKEMLESTPSHGTTSAEGISSVPVLSLSEDKSVLTTLLSAIFPVHLVIPETYEEMVQVFSAAYKYKLQSVVSILNTGFPELVPSMISRDDAFRAFCLARRYGLVDEAIPAAQTAIKDYEDIERLGAKLLFANDSSLGELWLYQQEVEKHVEPAVSALRKSEYAQKIAESCKDGAWLADFFDTVSDEVSVRAPSLLQTAFRSHTSSSSCEFCDDSTIEEVFSFGKSVQATVNEALNKARDAFRALCNSNDCPPKPPYQRSDSDTPFDSPDADVILRSSDSCDFRVRKSILAMSSDFFKDMFSLPTPCREANQSEGDQSDPFDGLPVINVSETKKILYGLLTAVYPVPMARLESYEDVLAVLGAAHKYQMDTAVDYIRGWIKLGRLPNLTSCPLPLAYALASRYRLEKETNDAVWSAIELPFTTHEFGAHLHAMDGASLYALSACRTRYRDAILSSLHSASKCNTPSAIAFVSPQTSNNAGTSCQSTDPDLSQDGRVVPKWWTGAFRDIIARLDRMDPFTITSLKIVNTFSAARTQHVGEGDGCRYCSRLDARRFGNVLEGEVEVAADMVEFYYGWEDQPTTSENSQSQA
ncbi:hypothetical protein BC834DRAFT_935728 [Gloeopeniophorella convolvens]|nr:hypothetical protein BC834DRAFT_935728 [Gloeopeniophorella convolvens]